MIILSPSLLACLLHSCVNCPISSSMKSPSHLLILLLVLPFFAIRVVARVVCFQSTCTSTYAPTNCVDAPTQPVGKTRREEASPLDSRGNGICYYPTGLLSKSLTVNTFSQVFFLPRGIYNLNWIEDITEGPPSTAIGTSLLPPHPLSRHSPCG